MVFLNRKNLAETVNKSQAAESLATSSQLRKSTRHKLQNWPSQLVTFDKSTRHKVHKKLTWCWQTRATPSEVSQGHQA